LIENNHIAKAKLNAKTNSAAEIEPAALPSASNPALEVLAKGIGEDRENLRSSQRWLKPGTPLYRQFQKKIDAKDRQLAELAKLHLKPAGSSRRKTKRVRRNEPAKKPTVKRRVEPALADTAKSQRLRGVGNCFAVSRMEAYVKSNGMDWTEFAEQVKTTEKTIRRFRKDAKIRATIFDSIARVMEISREALLKSE
jgi:hypothetical protein